MNKDKGFSLVEFLSFISILSILGGLMASQIMKIKMESEKIMAIKNIISIKNQCEKNYIYGIKSFINLSTKGYELELKDLDSCDGDPNHGFINLIPIKNKKNPNFYYDFKTGLIKCLIQNKELTSFPDCKLLTKSKNRYRCMDVGNWELAQELLMQGHSYLDRDKDGEACESLRRKLNKPRIGKLTIDNCYDGDTCTSITGEKIRLACIDSPEIRGTYANPEKAKKSRDFLNNLIAGKEVNIRRITQDRYGRTVGELSLNGVNFQKELVISGHATIYKKYSAPCKWASNKI